MQNNEVIGNRVPINKDNPSIKRDLEKCIDCGICKNICSLKTGIKYKSGQTINNECINCGACLLNCPMTAITPQYSYKKVLEELDNTDKIVIVSTSPSVRVSLGEAFGMEAGSFVEGKMITALKTLGFNYVLDTTFGADLTIMEEANELVDRIINNKSLPMFTSCCPAWVKHLEINYPQLLPHLSSCKSPIGMQGAIIKTYFSKLNNIDPKKIVNVALTPCVAKKAEIVREEMNDSSKYNEISTLKDMDYVITTSEFALMLKEKGIDFSNLEDGKYDSLLSKGSGAGVLFGASGGVMEAAIRTCYNILTGLDPKEKLLTFEKVRGMDNVKEASITIGDKDLKVAVIHGLDNVKPFLEEIQANKSNYSFIEVMNCTGGCIGGAGQIKPPISDQKEVIQKRMQSLYVDDNSSEIKCSYQNKDIQKIYQDFLNKPLSDLSEELLHTSYYDKSELKEKEVNYN